MRSRCSTHTPSSLTSILLSRLSLDLREVNGGYTDGGEVLTRTLRDIPDFVHSADPDDDLSARPSADHTGEVHPIDGETYASFKFPEVLTRRPLSQMNQCWTAQTRTVTVWRLPHKRYYLMHDRALRRTMYYTLPYRNEDINVCLH